MSDTKPGEGAFEVEALLRQLAELEDGALGPDGVEALMDQLNRSRAARRIYLDYFQDSASLRHIAKILDERGKMPFVEDRLASRKIFRMSVLAAAAAVALLGVVAALVGISMPEVSKVAARAVAGTEWTVNAESRGTDHEELEIRAGSTVRVLSGTVRLEDDSGVVMLVGGPAEVSFPGLDRPVLRHGWLWIDAAGGADPIEVRTPELTVRDIGTRFGVRVRGDRATEVHLVEGKVEVTARNVSEKPLVLEPEDSGLFVSTKGSRSGIPLASDPFPGLRELLEQEASYQTTILSQAPAGYWRLDDRAPGALANEIPGGTAGRFNPPVAQGEEGVGSDGVFAGFDNRNRSVFLPGDDYESLLYNLDIPERISREEGGVSFWIRRSPTDQRREVLWLAGKESDDPLQAPAESIMHAQLTPSGQVEFFVENGEFDLLLSSNFSVVDDKWHHVAASWGPTAVELYVDGRRVGRIDDFGSLQQGALRGRDVRFGKPSDDLKSEGAEQFTGWVDEIAVWRRPLSGAEVAHQFRSAKGVKGKSGISKE